MIRRKIVIEADMFYSDAYQGLKPSSIKVLQRFLQKRTWDNKDKKYNNDILVFTYSEAEALGISRSQFQRSLRELFETGFIEIYHQGGQFGQGKDFSRYRLIDTWRLYGTSNFPSLKKKKGVNTGGFDEYNALRIHHP